MTHDTDDDDEVFIDESQSVLPPTKKIKLDRKPSLVTKMKTKPRPDSMKSKTSVRTRGENGATTSGESGSMTSGESGSMMNNDDAEFQEAQEIPNEDFDYVLPPAPEPVQREIIDEKDVLLMAPRPVVAYRLGFGNKFLCLVAQQGVLVAKLVDTVERGGFPVPNGEKIIKLEAMEMAGLDYFLPEFRATMHDDGPMYGEKTKHVGGLHFMGLNSQYREALDICSFFRRLPTAKPSATKKGVRLSTQEVDDMALIMPIVKAGWAQLAAIQSIGCQVNHSRVICLQPWQSTSGHNKPFHENNTKSPSDK